MSLVVTDASSGVKAVGPTSMGLGVSATAGMGVVTMVPGEAAGTTAGPCVDEIGGALAGSPTATRATLGGAATGAGVTAGAGATTGAAAGGGGTTTLGGRSVAGST